MAHNRDNTTAFVEATQYSNFIIANLPELMLPEMMTRDVSDFGSGTTLNIKTVGSSTIQDVAEGEPMSFNAIDTGTVTLSITDYIGDAWFISDELRQDGAQVDQLHVAKSLESTRAIAENVETKFLSAANAAQTAANVNLVNGRPHRWVAGGAGGTNRIMTMSDFVAMKLAFDKAKVPAMGRIAIVDPIVEATLNSLTNIVNVSNNPQFEGLVETGFAENHQFVRNIFGFDVYVSNMLPTKTAQEALDASSYGLANDTAEVGDVANIFMSVLDDQTKPLMKATRTQPSVEGWRDYENRQDNFQVSTRFGFGAQRVDTLGVIFTDEATY